jgi:hypothetical protein
MFISQVEADSHNPVTGGHTNRPVNYGALSSATNLDSQDIFNIHGVS